MKSRYIIDKSVRVGFFLAAVISVLVLLGIFLMLVYNGLQAFSTISVREFFLTTRWNPSAYGQPSYGILSMVVSTVLVTAGAMILSIPLGIGAAAYLSEGASPRLREGLKPAIELLAAIPSVAIGFVGIVLVGPALARLFGLNNGLNALNGSLLLAVMALPTIVTVAEDAIRAVPASFKEAAYSLGANRWQTLMKVTLPSAASGIVAAVILGMGRAIGETMAVLMATGNAGAMPSGFFDPVRTMTATIAIEMGEVPYGTTHYYSLFAVGAVLFLISLGVNLLAESLAGRRRYRT